MRSIDIRPTHKILQQIAEIERRSGRLDMLARGSLGSLKLLPDKVLKLGVAAASALDSTTTGGLLILEDVLDWSKESTIAELQDTKEGEDCFQTLESKAPGLIKFLHAHSLEDSAKFSLDGNLIFDLYTRNFSDSTDRESLLRDSPGYLLTPEKEIVFPTVSAFILEDRLGELTRWTHAELRAGLFHPLLVLGVFYLLFLQTSPFKSDNHRIAQLLLWKLLLHEGYSFVRLAHFSPYFLAHRGRYANSLRRAEKSAYQGNWSSLGIWIEFYLETLCHSAAKALRLCETQLDLSRLSTVQKQILGVVRDHGSATRERIATETGINLSTVKYNLSVLSSKGHLKRQGGGRTTSYLPV